MPQSLCMMMEEQAGGSFEAYEGLGVLVTSHSEHPYSSPTGTQHPSYLVLVDAL
jgi:hypothetical protein